MKKAVFSDKNVCSFRKSGRAECIYELPCRTKNCHRVTKGALPRWYIPWYIPWYQAGPADFEQKSGGFCESAVDTRNPPDFDGPADFMK
jgi:hypothetical protein